MLKKFEQVAFIREAECIGCTKCIDACPVDAILGSSKLMHTVIANECISCQLCVPVCPIDCVEMIARQNAVDNEVLANQAKIRIKARTNRKLKSLPVITVNKKEYLEEILNRQKQ